MIGELHVILRAAPDGGQEAGGGAGREQERADVVDRVLLGRRLPHEAEPDDGEREDGEGEVDEEAPAPGAVVGQPAADGGAEDGRRSEDGARESLPLSALAVAG